MGQQSNSKNKPLYNSSLTKTYLTFIKSRYSFIDIKELLNYANMLPSEVEDEGHWFTQNQINLFHEKLQELTKNQDIAQEAGQFATAPETLGKLRSYFLSLGGPARAYEIIGEIAKKITKSSVYESKRLSSNKVEIIVTPNKGTKEEPFQCKNRIGNFKGLFKVFALKPPKIEHSECIFKGGEVCRYIISWEKSSLNLFQQIRNYVAIILIIICCTSPFFFELKGISIVLSVSAFITAFLSWLIERSKNKELTKYQDTNIQAFDELKDQIDINYENALLVKEVSEVLSTEVDLKGIIQQVVQILEKRLKYDRGLVMLANENQTKLMYSAGFGYTDKQKEYWIENKFFFHLDKPDSRGFFVVAFRKGTPFLIEDINKIKDTLSHESQDIVKKLNVKSMICCPIMYGNKSLGILVVENWDTIGPPGQRDVNLLMGIASQIGISINHIRTRAEYFKEKEAKIELKAKEDLIGRAIHNIRNPIDIVHTYLDLIRLKENPNPKLINKLNKMEIHVTRIEELASNFLMYLKPINERTEKIDLNDFMERDIIPRFDHILKDKQKQINFNFTSMKEIHADKNGIKYIIEEIIQNGFKHKATNISIKNHILDDKVVFTFENNGEPIPKEFQDIIFAPFKTSDPLGTGLGMANVKRIVEDHQGEIKYDENFLEGTRFIIELQNLMQKELQNEV